jgi:hypothetical protein
MYICRERPDYVSAFTPGLSDAVRNDFVALAPLYRLLRGYQDELVPE